ncbi:MAG: trypsin-like peptidase domain-containing protein [Spirochaetes bacterium]|nr:trypsin-like peptidase domain-containing protein [Spirochaetota bacterium]
MKLYSRNQVLAVVAAVAVVTLVAGAAVSALVVAPRLAAAAAAEASAAAVPAAPASGETAVRVPVQYVAATTGSLADEQNNIEVYERVNKSVVYITTITLEYSYFFEAMPQEGTGSGIIIDTEGHVLTNYHVVKGADQLRITLSDGTELEGKVTGTDPENDLAVVKFDPKGRVVVPVTFGSSSNLKVGQKVLAIGNPFGLDRTLTTGIISALGRPLQNTEENTVIRSAIQTDAAINPGNSGGPLLNARGELIGINAAIYSTSGSSAGVGFAIPVNTARRVVDELLRYGAVRRGWIDIEPIQLFPALVSYFKLPVKNGVLVSQAGASAKQAGLRGGDQSSAVRYGRTIIYGGGDIIVEVGGQKVASYSDLLGALEQTKPGEVVSVKVIRSGQEKTLSVKLVERPSQ